MIITEEEICINENRLQAKTRYLKKNEGKYTTLVCASLGKNDLLMKNFKNNLLLLYTSVMKV